MTSKTSDGYQQSIPISTRPASYAEAGEPTYAEVKGKQSLPALPTQDTGTEAMYAEAAPVAALEPVEYQYSDSLLDARQGSATTTDYEYQNLNEASEA